MLTGITSVLSVWFTQQTCDMRNCFLIWKFVWEILDTAKVLVKKNNNWQFSKYSYIFVAWSLQETNLSIIEIFARIYFRAPSTKDQNSVPIFAQFRANILLKHNFCIILFQNMKFKNFRADKFSRTCKKRANWASARKRAKICPRENFYE